MGLLVALPRRKKPYFCGERRASREIVEEEDTEFEEDDDEEEKVEVESRRARNNMTI